MNFSYGQSGEASRWRVCYQRGLPRLVFDTTTAYLVFALLQQILRKYVLLLWQVCKQGNMFIAIILFCQKETLGPVAKASNMYTGLPSVPCGLSSEQVIMTILSQTLILGL